MGDVRDVSQLDHPVGQQPQAPAVSAFRRLAAGQGDEVRLLVAVQFALPGQQRGWAVERGVEALFHEALAHPVEGGEADLEGVGEGVIAPASSAFPLVGFEQQASGREGARRGLASGEEFWKVGALLIGEADPLLPGPGRFPSG